MAVFVHPIKAFDCLKSKEVFAKSMKKKKFSCRAGKVQCTTKISYVQMIQSEIIIESSSSICTIRILINICT